MNNIGTVTPKEPPQVRSQVEDFANNLEKLEIAVNNITDQVSPILREAAPPEDKKVSKEVEQSLAPLAHDLRQLNQRLRRHIKNIISVTNRVEV